MKKKVVIVVPIYRDFTPTERVSFEQGIKVLSDYTFNLLHPRRFSVEGIMATYGDRVQLTETALADEHFTSVASYSDLLLTEAFYQLYADYEFMLIYQLDAYVFENRLEEWLAKGYDYVGAPWIPSEYWWKATVGRLVCCLRNLGATDLTRIHYSNKYFAVGNGGFSLRRIETMRQVMADDRELIARCPYYEDFYISQVATLTHTLRLPSWREALKFSFEQSLQHCFRLNHHQLPFGCHYWSHEKYYKRFWHRFIKV